MSKPLARHLPAVAHAVERVVGNRRGRLKIEDDDRNFGSLHHRQDSRGQGVGSHMQEDQVNIRLPKAVAGLDRFLRCVDQTQVDDLDAGPCQPGLDHAQIAFQPLFQSFELRPVRRQTDAEQADTGGSHR